jgi:hypothetical protein
MPFLNPEWWQDMEEFAERWRRYREGNSKEESIPQGAL